MVHGMRVGEWRGQGGGGRAEIRRDSPVSNIFVNVMQILQEVREEQKGLYEQSLSGGLWMKLMILSELLSTKTGSAA
jgi:hypothetical protein